MSIIRKLALLLPLALAIPATAVASASPTCTDGQTDVVACRKAAIARACAKGSASACASPNNPCRPGSISPEWRSYCRGLI